MLEFGSDAELEPAPGFAQLGMIAFTTTRATGSFGLHEGSVAEVVGRWMLLEGRLRTYTSRLVLARQVHATQIIEHVGGWSGWLRCPEGDGHLSVAEPTAMAVTLADCVPVFIGHPSGSGALLHAGWKGTAAHLVRDAIGRLRALGLPPDELQVHCGPAICGRCYQVGPDVYHRLTGDSAVTPRLVDLRHLILRDAAAEGVVALSASPRCTRCDNDRFYSHRCGDTGRHVGVLVSHASGERR